MTKLERILRIGQDWTGFDRIRQDLIGFDIIQQDLTVQNRNTTQTVLALKGAALIRVTVSFEMFQSISFEKFHAMYNNMC